MKYRNQMYDSLDLIESDIKALKSIVQRQEPINTYLDRLKSLESKTEKLRNLLNIEPTTPNESLR